MHIIRKLIDTKMGKIYSPHDKVFKSAMADVRIARDFFEHHLPSSIRNVIDFKTLRLWPNSYVDEKLALSCSDILYQVNIAGNKAFLYLLCEHQSSVDALMPFRIWQYIVNIWSDYLKQIPKSKRRSTKLPLVVPMVFYHGHKPYNGSKDIRELIDAPIELIDEILFKSFQLIDTHEITDETLREQHWAGVMTFVLKHIYIRDILLLKETLLEMFKTLENAHGESVYKYIMLLLNYLLETGDTKHPNIFIDDIQTGLSTPIKGGIMTVAEWLRQEGKQNGESSMLMRLIERKFGDIPPSYRARIEQANSDSLLHWGDRILEVDTLNALFED